MTKINPAIDVSKFYNLEIDGLFSDPIRMLTVGRLHWKKGIDYLLEALSLVNETGTNFALNIVGEGDEMERLSYAALQYGVSDKVTFSKKKALMILPIL